MNEKQNESNVSLDCSKNKSVKLETLPHGTTTCSLSLLNICKFNIYQPQDSIMSFIFKSGDSIKLG